MKPQYIRVIKSFNQDVQYSISSPGAVNVRAVRPALNHQHIVPSVQFLRTFATANATTPARIIINSSASTIGLSNEATIRTANNLTTTARVPEALEQSLSSSVDIPVMTSNDNSSTPITDLCKCILFSFQC